MLKTRYRKNFRSIYGLLGRGLSVKPSIITGAGRGVFTEKDIPSETVITEYCGYKRRVKYRKSKGGASTKYHYEISGSTKVLVGIRTKSMLLGRGVGQLANDAISRGLNGIDNNCGFYEEDGRVYLISKRRILKGEELLVNYGLQYWIQEFIRDPFQFSKKYQDWFNSIIKICDVWYQYRSMRVYRIIDAFDYEYGFKEKYEAVRKKIILVLDQSTYVCCQKIQHIHMIIKKNIKGDGSTVHVLCHKCESTINIGEFHC